MSGKLTMIIGDTWERARELFLRRVESTPSEQIEYVRYSLGAEMLALRDGDQFIMGSLRSLRTVRGRSLDVVEVEHELTDEQRAAILPCFAITGGTVIVGDREPTGSGVTRGE